MNKDSTLILRKIIGKRFDIGTHLVKPEDISTLMKYFTMHDLEEFTEEEMSAFLAKGRETGMFFNRNDGPRE